MKTKMKKFVAHITKHGYCRAIVATRINDLRRGRTVTFIMDRETREVFYVPDSRGMPQRYSTSIVHIIRQFHIPAIGHYLP
jgi:hypothetical protein